MKHTLFFLLAISCMLQTAIIYNQFDNIKQQRHVAALLREANLRLEASFATPIKGGRP